MNRFALKFDRKTLLATICAAMLMLVVPAANAQDNDPPAEAGRISSISGTVSVQPVGSQDWGQAYPNLTLGPGDRIFTDSNGRAEIQVGQSYLRIGPNSDVSLVEDSQFNINFGVAQGSVHLHTYALWPRQLMGVSTPNGNIEFQKAGDLRVDVYPTDGATVFTNYGEFADVTAAGDYRQALDNGQSLQLSGSNPVYPQWLQPAGADDLDSWSQQRDQQLSQVASYQYVSPDVPGAADLDSNGDWQPDTEYGPVWFPRSVAADWTPYHYGHWVNHAPWGWIWVEDESWGYAPFHYGRWVSYRGRWGWIPGPRTVRPVYSPALVVFAGGVNIGGSGVSVWFPLGPGEAYRPWYRCSPNYIDRVNISNIRASRNVHVQNTYVNVVNVTNITYVNQSRGATAMRHEDFASGRDGRNASVRVDPRQMEHVRSLQRPEPAPTPRSIVSRPVAQPVRVSSERPRLINQQGQQIVARPGATPVAAPVRPTQSPKPIPGRTVIASPAHPGNPAGKPMPPGQGRQDQNQPANANQGGQARPGQQVPGQPAAGRPVPPNAGQQDRNPSQPAAVNPGGQPRPTPQQPVQPGVRPNQPNRPELNPNQPAATLPNGQPRPTPQQPERQDQRQAPPNANQQERNPDQSPATLPNGKPRPNPQQPERQDQRQSPPNANQQERNPNQPPATLPNGQPRPTPQQPERQDQRQSPPNANQQERNPNQPPATLPNGQPRPTPQQPERQDQRQSPPNANQQERNPNQPPATLPNGQPRPTPQQPTRPEQRPMPPNTGPQERNQNQPPVVRQNAQPPAQPVQPPVQRQESRPSPPPQNRQEARPEPQQQNRPEARPTPPPQNRPESRPEARPNQSPQNHPDTRPAPPPQSRPEAHPAPPPHQEQPQKNEKKKDDKKPQ